MSQTIRTFEATITNQQQVRDDLNQLGWAASKLWNVGRYYAQEQWDKMGEIPDDGELKAELKGHERYTDLHSQSSSFETAKPSRDANELRSLSTARSRRTR